MAAQYKLTYFNVEGRGEPIRLLFAASGTSYKDNRVELKFNDKGIPQPEPGAAWKSGESLSLICLNIRIT